MKYEVKEDFDFNTKRVKEFITRRWLINQQYWPAFYTRYERFWFKIGYNYEKFLKRKSA